MDLDPTDNDIDDEELGDSIGGGMSEFSTVSKNKKEENDLRKVFIQNYGVQMEFPGYYIALAKFVPHYDDYVVQASFHIIPKGYSQTVQTT